MQFYNNNNNNNCHHFYHQIFPTKSSFIPLAFELSVTCNIVSLAARPNGVQKSTHSPSPQLSHPTHNSSHSPVMLIILLPATFSTPGTLPSTSVLIKSHENVPWGGSGYHKTINIVNCSNGAPNETPSLSKPTPLRPHLPQDERHCVPRIKCHRAAAVVPG